ncbi:AI-2E family transporter [Frateuria aurantia]
MPSPAVRISSYVLAALALLLVMQFKLLPCLLAGLLVYTLVAALAPLLGQRISGDRARAVVVAILGVVVVGLMVLLIMGGISFYHHEIGNPEALLQNQVMPLVDRARQQLPSIVVDHLPDSVDDLRQMASSLSRKHASALQLAGREAARSLVHVFMGLLLGAIVALSQTSGSRSPKPLAAALAERCRQLTAAFRQIVFAQIKISLVNTALTSIFLLIALPVAGVNIPLAKTLVALTFLAGLLPVVGNLVSNVMIVVAALSVSSWVAVVALAYLVAVHKLEYILNARIVGSRINARAWELLLAMLAMEAIYGLPGLIAAPIFYAYLKRELEQAELV